MEKTIRELIKKAMIEKDKLASITYKNILEGAQKIAKSNSADAIVTDDMIIKATQNEIKQLNDLKQYCTNDPERLNEVTAKIKYCEAILPQMVSDEEVMKYLVDNNIDKNIGICMKSLKEHFGSKLDSKAASVVAKNYVNS